MWVVVQIRAAVSRARLSTITISFLTVPSTSSLNLTVRSSPNHPSLLGLCEPLLIHRLWIGRTEGDLSCIVRDSGRIQEDDTRPVDKEGRG